MIVTLSKGTALDLLRWKDEQLDDLKFMVNDISSGLTIAKAIEAPKIFHLRKKLGDATVLKLLCVTIYSFCDSIKAKNTMGSADIIECSEMIMEQYPVETVKDIVLALKNAKRRGMNFYSTVSTPVVFEIITEYMDQKALYLEKEWKDQKGKTDGSVNSEAYSRSVESERKLQNQKDLHEMKELKLVQKEKNDLEKIHNLIDKTLNGQSTNNH